jgi:FkbM family methyltransferase
VLTSSEDGFEKWFASSARLIYRETSGCGSVRVTLGNMDFEAFSRELLAAHERLEAKREAFVNLLARETSVIVYSYGSRGGDLAIQLRNAGIECLIFDNSKRSVERANADGFTTISDINRDLPLIVAAGQNQLSILSGLSRPAYSLAEALYAFNLVNQCAKARMFSDTISTIADGLYQVYRRLDPNCQQDFLNVLLYRSSLDVNHIALTRKPMAQMWMPPEAIRTINSFCDVGAYDGDTLINMKAAFPALISTFAVEPSPDLASNIEAAALSNKLKSRIFTGAAWSHKTRLSCRVYPNGMMAMTEDKSGSIEGDALDDILPGEQFDYIKFDVEGAEGNSMKGAPSLLRNARCIAIASYHLPNDLVDIPSAISAIIGSEYSTEWRCAFRHYSECFDDSIFYFYRANE